MLCKDPPKDKTNLKITKTALSCFKIAGNKIRCGYHVRVWNMGPGVYNDKIIVNESVPAGATPIFSGPPALGWNCVGGNPYACTSNPVVLNPGQNALLVVRLDVTQAQAKQNDCKLKNTARRSHMRREAATRTPTRRTTPPRPRPTSRPISAIRRPGRPT